MKQVLDYLRLLLPTMQMAAYSGDHVCLVRRPTLAHASYVHRIAPDANGAVTIAANGACTSKASGTGAKITTKSTAGTCTITYSAASATNYNSATVTKTTAVQ